MPSHELVINYTSTVITLYDNDPNPMPSKIYILDPSSSSVQSKINTEENNDKSRINAEGKMTRK